MFTLHAAGNYFEDISGRNVTFPPGSSAGDEVCASTLIYSDGVLEVSEATGNVEVFPRQFGLAFVPVEQRFARVTIVDANGKQLKSCLKDPWDGIQAQHFKAPKQLPSSNPLSLVLKIKALTRS